MAATGAQVKEARIALEDTKLKAPTAALVLKRKVEVGDLVNSGTVGFTLANTEDVKVVFGISDLMLKHLKLGDQLAVTTEALRGRAFRGLVTAISPSADPKSRVFDVEITIPNPDQNLKVGMIAAVAVATGQAPTASDRGAADCRGALQDQPRGLRPVRGGREGRQTDRPPAG